MNVARQTALSSARRARLPQASRQPRRYAHDTHDAGHHATSAHIDSSATFSRFFYVLLGIVPTSYVIYSVSRPSKDGERHFLTKWMDVYEEWQEVNARRNATHTKAVEDAAAVRHLFYGQGSRTAYDMKFPEMMNTGSPWNVKAGQSGNISGAIAKYERENYEDYRSREEQLKNGTLPVELPLRSSHRPPLSETGK